MPLLTIVPPIPGAGRRFKPFVDFVQAAGWKTEFVRLDWTGQQPNFESPALFPQVDYSAKEDFWPHATASNDSLNGVQVTDLRLKWHLHRT